MVHWCRLTYLLHVAESFFKKLTDFAANQEIPHILWNPKVHYCSHKHPSRLWVFLNVFFHGEELLAPSPTPKLEDHPLSAVRDCLFNLFTATLHIGGRSSICNLRTRHAVVTGTHKHGLCRLHNFFLFHSVNDSKQTRRTCCCRSKKDAYYLILKINRQYA